MQTRLMFRILCSLVVLSLVAGCGKKSESAQAPAASAALSGAELYAARCALCHGAKGAGDTSLGRGNPNANLTDAEWAYGGSKEDIARTTSEGIPETTMRGFRGVMTPQEIDAVAEYVSRLATTPGS